MRNAYNNLDIEDNVTEKLLKQLKLILPELCEFSSHVKSRPGSRFDLYARDKSGKEYFIEIKARRVHRIDVGQVVEQAAALSIERPNADVILICASIDPAVKEVLAKAGIRTIEFPDLGLWEQVNDKVQSVPLNLSPIEQQAYFALLRNEMKVISTKEFALLMDMSLQRSKNLLVALNKRGVIFRFGKGKYAVLPPDVLFERRSYTADPYLIIDALMHGSEYYIAYNSAAHLHGIATQIPFTAYIASLKQRRLINLGNARIKFVTIKKSRFFGIENQNYFGSQIIVSDVEKTIIDCLDRSDLVGGVDESTHILAEAIDKVNYEKLMKYVKMMQKKVLIQRLGFILEKLTSIGYKVPEIILNRLETMVEHKYVYPLDPKLKRKGKKSNRWQILENVNCLKWYYA